MNWLKPTPYCQLSENGHYSVAKVYGAGIASYEAWRTRSHPDGPHCIAVNLPGPDEARQACESHERVEA